MDTGILEYWVQHCELTECYPDGLSDAVVSDDGGARGNSKVLLVLAGGGDDLAKRNWNAGCVQADQAEPSRDGPT